MTTRTISFAEGEFYHIYNRGTDKRTIFKDNSDYRRFMELLFLTNTTDSVNIRDIRKITDSIYALERADMLVHIGAFCLMPNHFHILLTPAVDGGIQKFMLKLSTGYSMYFNKRYIRTGALFEGRFKSEHVHSDEYLKYLFSYIHLNPIKLIQPEWKESGIKDMLLAKKYLDTYHYSSFLDYRTQREESNILSRQAFPKYFEDKASIDSEILEWLTYKDR